MRMISTSTGARSAHAPFASDVAYYLALNPRQLPSRYLYDPLGSALFEAICRLPWYGLTRAEKRLLTAHAAEVWRSGQDVHTVVELGPGSGEKLALLLAAAPGTRLRRDVHLVDVSSSALTQAAQTVSAAPVDVVAHECDYETGLLRFADARTASTRALIAFLGSNLGNFDEPGREAFLRNIRAALRTGDGLLLGVDLVKAEADLILGYDDPLGVTAAFNRNLLVRINRELGGDFALDEFFHRAVWNAEHSRIEMHLCSRRNQTVRIVASQLEFAIEAGESIWTESSYKFTINSLAALLGRNGFAVTNQWIDDEEPFALTLAAAI